MAKIVDRLEILGDIASLSGALGTGIPFLLGLAAPQWLFPAPGTRGAATVAAVLGAIFGAQDGLAKRRQSSTAPPPRRFLAFLLLVVSTMYFAFVMAAIERRLDDVPPILWLVEVMIDVPQLAWFLIGIGYACMVGTLVSLVTCMLPPKT